MPTDVITDITELRNIEPEWLDLWRRTPAATPFQSPMWLLPWLRAFGNGELVVFAGRENGELTSLAPLLVLRDDDESLGMVLGTGNSDYIDVLGPRDAADSIVARLADVDCQMWDFQQLRPSALLLEAAAPPGWSADVSEQDRCPILPIEGAGGELGNLISPHFRKKLRYYWRSLDRLGRVSIEEPGDASLDSMMDALFELHAARWKKKGLPGMLADETDQRFHREAARAMLQAGSLRMYATRLDDRVVAVFYGFADRDAVYYYLSGYDPELERQSIGTVIVAHAIEQAVLSGAKTFDFLRGAEQYKYSWGATDRVNSRRQLFKG